MTREDAISILAVLKAAYPNFYRGMTRVDANAAIDLWATMFDTEDASLVGAAVKTFIASDSKGFPPSIGEIKEKIRKLTQPEEMTEAEAWGVIGKAVGNSLYSSQKEFDKLPETLKRIVGSPSQLKEWAMIDAETLQTVVASNFQRSYRAVSVSQREMEAIPQSVKKMFEVVKNNLALEDGK